MMMIGMTNTGILPLFPALEDAFPVEDFVLFVIEGSEEDGKIALGTVEGVLVLVVIIVVDGVDEG
jgi:hypothetical protein